MMEEIRNNEEIVEEFVEEFNETEEKPGLVSRVKSFANQNGKKALKIGAIGAGLIVAFVLGSKLGGSEDEYEFEDETSEEDESEDETGE